MTMPSPRYLRHITLNTGHQRDSRKSEISDDALDACREIIESLVATGFASLPGPPGYSVAGIAGAKTTAEEIFADAVQRLVDLPIPGRCLTAAVVRDDAPGRPLAIIAVADHQRCGAQVWANLRMVAEAYGMTPPTSLRQPPTPWCAALLLPAIIDDSSLDWLGDFERCLAWAWVVHIRTPEVQDVDDLEEHALRPGGPARPVGGSG